jgi:hypothetical protein
VKSHLVWVFMLVFISALLGCGDGSSGASTEGEQRKDEQEGEPSGTADSPEERIESSPSQGPSATTDFTPVLSSSLWPDAELTTAQRNCVSSAMQSNPAADPDIVTRSCVCIMDQASRRWTFSDFSANEYSYTQQLLSDGTADWCRAFANEADAKGKTK